MFGRATITLGIGPHSSSSFFFLISFCFLFTAVVVGPIFQLCSELKHFVYRRPAYIVLLFVCV